jgi:RNA polymerase sigma factor (sigma-70 family)
MVSPSAAASSPGPDRDEEITGFFIANHRELRAYLIGVCRCPEHEVDDIVQDSFLAVREQWDHVRDYQKPKAYLYKVAVRRFGRLRQQQAETCYPGDPEPRLQAFRDPVDAIDAVDRRDMALALLKQLPLRQRQVMWLREGAGFSEAETAQILSVSIGTVKSQLHDAVAGIRKLKQKARGNERRAPAP